MKYYFFIKKSVCFNVTNNEFKAIQVEKELHRKIAVQAKFNEIKMKTLTSKLLAHMFDQHADEVKEIIKEIKVKKG